MPRPTAYSTTACHGKPYGELPSVAADTHPEIRPGLDGDARAGPCACRSARFAHLDKESNQMAGISTLGPGPSILPGAAIPLDSGGESSEESSNGDDIVVVDLSDKKLERQLVFTSVQSQDQQQTTVTEDGSKQSDSQNTSVNSDSETTQEGAQEGGGGDGGGGEDDGPPPTPPDLSALDNPFFTRPSRSGLGSRRSPFGSSRSSSPFAGTGVGNSVFQGTGLGGSSFSSPGSSGVGGVFPGLGIGVDDESFDIFGDERPPPGPPERASESRSPLPSQISQLGSLADSELARANDLAARLSAQFGFSGGILDIVI